MAKVGLLSLDDLDSPEVEPDDSTAAIGDTADDQNNEENAFDPDAPLELLDVSELKVTELAELEAKQAEENKTRVEMLSGDGQVLLTRLDRAFENFKQSCVSKAGGDLRLAQEEQQGVIEEGGMVGEQALEVPAEAADLTDAILSPALESLGTTLSGVIKAIYAMLKKTLAFLRDMLREMWRQHASLNKAIAVRSNEIISLRKSLDKQLPIFANSFGVKPESYVQIGTHKQHLLLAGKLVYEDQTTYSEQFKKLNELVGSSELYLAFVESLPGAFEKHLEYIKANSDGVFDQAVINGFYADVPNYQALPVHLALQAQHAHGLTPTEDTNLLISGEYIGNFFQASLHPNTKFLNTNPNIAQIYAVWKVQYTKDSAVAIGNDTMPMLINSEITAASVEASKGAMEMIKAQRCADRTTHHLDTMSEILKKVDSFVWQNNQGDPAIAAEKNQQLLGIAQAIGSIESNIQRFFSEVLLHTRNVNHAWYAYLTATLMFERDLARKGVNNHQKPE